MASKPTIGVYSVVVACLAFTSCGDKALDPLRSTLNKENYNLVYPVRTGVVPGGFVVSDGKDASYYQLPPSVAPPAATDITATWGQEQISSSITVSALVSGIAKAVQSGGGSVNHDSQITLSQIDATGHQVSDPQAILQNASVKALLTGWLNDTGHHYEVYEVDTILSTQNIKLTGAGDTNITGAVGTTIPTCPPTSSAASSGTVASAGTGPSAASLGSAISSATSSSTPTGSLQICTNSKTQLTITTTTPEVFAASLRPVILSNGNLKALPVFQVVTGGGHFALTLTHPRRAPVTIKKMERWPTNS